MRLVLHPTNTRPAPAPKPSREAGENGHSQADPAGPAQNRIAPRAIVYPRPARLPPKKAITKTSAASAAFPDVLNSPLPDASDVSASLCFRTRDPSHNDTTPTRRKHKRTWAQTASGLHIVAFAQILTLCGGPARGPCAGRHGEGDGGDAAQPATASITLDDAAETAPGSTPNLAGRVAAGYAFASTPRASLIRA